ncbi:MAG: hypothetical protein RLZZ292_476 [Bacteroidota bacterium]|jgi:uncharacterized membrane protein YphA (DoxX/SURF4 family)
MNLFNLLTIFSISGAILTALMVWRGVHKVWWMSFLQNFTGVWLLFSGVVKAIDPIGTQYKMEQYFAEFETTFAGTKMAFLAPMFPALSKYALGFSIFMILFELVLGLMLIIGVRPKVSSWLLFWLMLFFTALTGFTYMTAYVPQGENFFEFGKWGPYLASNMRVTDCGCFGDFIKLIPRTSFFKDIFLMGIVVTFLLNHKKMHVLFTRPWRFGLTVFSIIASFVFCLQNTFWNLPMVDFRPFKIGTDLVAKKEAEEKAAAAIQITGYIMENQKTGEKQQVDVPSGQEAAKFYVDYIYKNFPKDAGWKVLDQVKTEPTVEHTKVSDLSLSNMEGSDYTEDILSDEKPSFLIVAPKLYTDKVIEKSIFVPDTIWQLDTVRTATTMTITKSLSSAGQKEIPVTEYTWSEDYLKNYKEKIAPLAKAAKAAGYKVNFAGPPTAPEKMRSFAKAAGLETNVDFYTCDDLVLKTIIRSNPGTVLLKKGVVKDMWHINQLPAFEAINLK